MKKIISLFLSIVLCFCITACSSSDSSETSAPSVSKAVTQTTAQTTAEIEVTTEKTSVSSTAKDEKRTEQKTSSKASTTKEYTSTAKANTKASTSKTTTAKKHTTRKPTVAAETTTVSQLNCYITIECKSIFDNMDDLKNGHEKYVPSDGVMLSSSQISVKDGDSVYDAVKAACDKNGVKMTATDSVYGKYIVGFNNIDEKDCGPQSGWVYTVNGVAPSKSCDKYILKNSDKIIFSYICKF